MNMDAIKQVGLRAAYRAGDVLKKHFGHLSGIQKKGIFDLVTEADLDSEKAIISSIRSTFPDHGILAKKAACTAQKASRCGSSIHWTARQTCAPTGHLFCIHRLRRGRPHSTGHCVQSRHSGIVYGRTGKRRLPEQPPHGALVHTRVQESLLVTGFTSDVGKRSPDLMNRFSTCLDTAQGIRRLGSAALDLCYVGCGRFDGFWEEI